MKESNMGGSTMFDERIELKQSEFRLFQELMYSYAGVRMNASKHALVQNRLRKRLRILGLSSYRAYHDYIADAAHKDEFQECLNCLTTNETYFFRHQHHWDFFTSVFLPAMREQGNRLRSIRIWSAAASTGAEAYSIAIALYDAFCGENGWQLTIDATDINEDVLKTAKEALYDNYAMQKLTKTARNRYFETPTPDSFRPRREVRQLVHFAKHNLMHPKAGASYDLIFLRNVLIYFDEISKSTVVENITRKLKPGGYLILGGAETLSSQKDEYTYVRPTIYRKK